MPGEYLYDCAAKAPELDTPVGRDLINEALWYKAFSEERRQELAVTTMEHSRYRECRDLSVEVMIKNSVFRRSWKSPTI